MKKDDEELESWFRQNISDRELIKWYKTKIVKQSNWLDKFEKTIETQEGEKPNP